MIYYNEPSCQIATLPDILYKVFGDKTSGQFVEFGAYDGRAWSNSWCLAELGWSGLYIEPIKDLYDRCVSNHKNHPEVVCLNSLVGRDKAKCVIYRKGDLYSISDIYITNEPMTMHQEMVSRSLDAILIEQNITAIDVLSIDVEGAEIDVLSNFSSGLYKPKLVIIEACESHSDLWKRVNIPFIDAYFDILYEKIYSDHINNIYVRIQP